MSKKLFFLLLFLCLCRFSCGHELAEWRLESNTWDKQSVINGVPSEDMEYESVGALIMTWRLFIQETKGKFYCTATLIASDTVITAAHCLHPDSFGYAQDERKLYFTFSRDVTSFKDWDPPLPENTYKIGAVVLHPDYSQSDLENAEGLGDNKDIALGFLSKPVDIFEPAIVMGTNDTWALYEDAKVEIAGYGASLYDEETDKSGIKRQAETFINRVGLYEMQIGDSNSVSQRCTADSGGPTFMNYNDAHLPSRRLVGIHSHAYSPNSSCFIGSVDTRVDVHRDWIEQEMIRACSDGIRVDCNNEGMLSSPLPRGTEIPQIEQPAQEESTQESEKTEQESGCRELPSHSVLVSIFIGFLIVLQRLYKER